VVIRGDPIEVIFLSKGESFLGIGFDCRLVLVGLPRFAVLNLDIGNLGCYPRLPPKCYAYSKFSS